MKLHRPELRRIARKSGGLFIGLLFHLPVRIVDETERYWMVTLDVGLIVWRLSFFLSWDRTSS